MGSYPSECIERFVALALRCCHTKQEKRPSMLEVVRELENILRILPETDTTDIESASTYSGKTAPAFSGMLASSSSFYASRDASKSSTLLGSDISSGVIPLTASLISKLENSVCLLISPTPPPQIVQFSEICKVGLIPKCRILINSKKSAYKVKNYFTIRRLDLTDGNLYSQ
ncbi:unnamed protein product [Dovyalis caffra]|uniref:Uncharacterized protein n=1 Tax=Dovyalis caffra TaxID=77055 RepID=A0AAV1QWG7_9ROSI|nr:unnamed protein product [Dovyalis caffra]